MVCKTAPSSSPVSKVCVANMGPTWVLSAPDGPHVGPMNLAIRVTLHATKGMVYFASIMRWEAGPRLNIKDRLSRYGDSHVKDKTAGRTSYL